LDGGAGGWKKFSNVDLQHLFSLDTNINRILIRRGVKVSGRVARIEEKRYAIEVFVGRSEGKKPPGRYL
jgi:hypothetical protein